MAVQQATARQTKGNSPYPYDEWKITQHAFDTRANLRDETVFAVGNGYLGVRGTFEEGYFGPAGTSVPGTYVNGFYDEHPISYGEIAYGYPEVGRTMLNVTDSRIIELWIGDERFNLTEGKILSFERTLDLKAGRLIRDVVWESPSGRQVKVHVERLASLERQHLLAFSYEVTPLNFDGQLVLVSALDGNVKNLDAEDDPRVGSAQGRMLLTDEVLAQDAFGGIRQRTKSSGLDLVCVMENAIETNSPASSEARGPGERVEVRYTMETQAVGERAEVRYTVDAKQSNSVRLTKVVAYYTSRDDVSRDNTSQENALRDNASQENALRDNASQDNAGSNLLEVARQQAAQGLADGFAALAREQEQFLENYWEVSDVQIQGDIALQQGVRFNAFHLLQSVGRDGRTNIASKGLTGEGYSGHYFWDTEVYVFPFFLYTHPEIARKLLEFRSGTLDKARDRAREMAHKGALYPWRTIAGEENSAYYPAGTAQYHINADIAYALSRYLRATEDDEYLANAGAEMLFETARLWADLGSYISRKGDRFCINMVTGPDEYTALVNNNFYTNLMAKVHLEDAVKAARWLQAHRPDDYAGLAQRIDLTEDEVVAWNRAAEAMYLGYDAELGIIPQDDTFLEKARWDFEHTPPENYPLLLHYHPLVIYRHQVLKQADVVLGLYAHGDRFSTAEKKRNFDYYEPLTTHDSSLSPCIYGIAAAELGYEEKAYNYFMHTARMDLDDYNGNVKDGIHTAAMAGAWLFIVQGFGGMREYSGQLHFQPRIPADWEGYRFRIAFQGRLLEVAVAQGEVTYQLLRGEPLTIWHFKRPLELEAGKVQSLSTRRTLEAVIFDLDGVITDTAEYHYKAWQQLADEMGIPFDRTVNERLRGISRMESLDIILDNAGVDVDAGEKVTLATRKNTYYKQLLEDITPADLLPGIADLLAELKAHGIRIGLASASRNAATVLDKLQLTDVFDAIVDAATVRKGKPDPEIFMAAADLLEVPYANCVGIEDAEAGIAAIQAAGMFAVGVGATEQTRRAEWIVADPSHITLETLSAEFGKAVR